MGVFIVNTPAPDIGHSSDPTFLRACSPVMSGCQAFPQRRSVTGQVAPREHLLLKVERAVAFLHMSSTDIDTPTSVPGPTPTAQGLSHPCLVCHVFRKA